MRFYEASSVVHASPERVWAVLTDGAAWPDWDSGVERVEGTIAAGQKVKVSVKANPGRAFPGRIVEIASQAE